MSEIINKNPNPWGNMGKALKPRKPNHVGRKTKSVIQIIVAGQDNQEWADRCNSAVNAVDAIIKHHKKKHPAMKFVKREFFLACVENGIAEYAKQEGIQLP